MNVIQLFRNKKTVKRQRTQEEKEQFLTAYFTELYKQNDPEDKHGIITAAEKIINEI